MGIKLAVCAVISWCMLGYQSGDPGGGGSAPAWTISQPTDGETFSDTTAIAANGTATGPNISYTLNARVSTGVIVASSSGFSNANSQWADSLYPASGTWVIGWNPEIELNPQAGGPPLNPPTVVIK